MLDTRNYDLDVYLYAKGWYKTTDMVKDLQQIYSMRNGIDAEYIRISDIIHCMATLVYKHLSKDPNSGKHNFVDLIFDFGPDGWSFRSRRYEGEYDYYKQVISKFLSILSLTEISEVPELKEHQPSENVLPLSENAKSLTKGK